MLIKLHKCTNVRVLVLALLFAITISCNSDNNPVEIDNQVDYSYQIPAEAADGWEPASLSSVGMDEVLFENLMNDLNAADEHNIHSLLVVRSGKLVFEEYFNGEKFKLAQYTGEEGFDMNDTHTLASATKSFTSALIGIATDRGFIQSVDQKVFDIFPEYSDILTGAPEKNDLTIKHLLTMTSGLDYDDQTYSYYDTRNDMNRMYASDDPIRFLLSKQMVTTPGMVYKYNNNNTVILGGIVHKTTGQRLDLFSENTLFGKMGITDFEWQVLPAGVILASGELRLRPRDMAKFGLLFLNNGIWNGEQIVSNEWVIESTQKHIDLYSNWLEDGYGYQWWCWDLVSQGRNYSAYMAQGWGGQWIIQIPDLGLVVVMTGGNYYTEPIMPVYTILMDIIIPSIR